MRFRQMEWIFWAGIISLLVLIGVIMIGSWKALGADNDPPCLTKEQARAKYPGQWLYWHTASRCWDNINTRSAHARATAAAFKSKPAVWGKENSLKLAKPLLDPNGNTPHHSGRPVIAEVKGPTVFYPELMNGGGTTDNMLRADTMTMWPPIADFDSDPPQFIPWQKRIAFNR